jgi:hypothetical protein
MTHFHHILREARPDLIRSGMTRMLQPFRTSRGEKVAVEEWFQKDHPLRAICGQEVRKLNHEDERKERDSDEEKKLLVPKHRIFSGIHLVICHYKEGTLAYWFLLVFTLLTVFCK